MALRSLTNCQNLTADMTFELEHKAGLVCIGGQSDTVLIQLNGEGAPMQNTAGSLIFMRF